MACFLNFNKKVIWIAPPKNGCSTLKSWYWYCEHDEIINQKDLSENKPTKYMNNIIRNTEYNLLDFDIYIIYRNIYDKFYSYLNNVVFHRLSNPILFKNDKHWINFLNVYKEKNNNNELTLNENIIHFMNIIIKININIFKNIDPHVYTQIRHIKYYFTFLNKNQTNPINENELLSKIKNKIHFLPIENMNTELKQNIENTYDKKINMNSSNVSMYIDNVKKNDFDSLNINDIPYSKILILNHFKYKNYIDKIYESDIFYFQDFNINIKTKIEYNIQNIREMLINIEAQLTNNELMHIYIKYNSHLNFNNELKKFNCNAFKYLNQKSFTKLNNIQLIEHYLFTKNSNNYKISFKNVPDDFNPQKYLSINPDLKDFNTEELYLHYENNGFYEKRNYK